MLPGYLLRLANTLGHAALAGRAPLLETLVVPIRIWPDDLDVYGHVNNGRFLTLMDLGRYDTFTRTGLGRAMIAQRMKPLVAGATIEFRRELRAFQTANLHSRILGWDEQALYFEHRLERGGQLCAHGLVRIVTKQGRRTVPPAECFALIGFHGSPPDDGGLLAPIRPTRLLRPEPRASVKPVD